MRRAAITVLFLLLGVSLLAAADVTFGPDGSITLTAPLQLAPGSASAPTYSSSGDTDSGLFMSGNEVHVAKDSADLGEVEVAGHSVDMSNVLNTTLTPSNYDPSSGSPSSGDVVDNHLFAIDNAIRSSTLGPWMVSDIPSASFNQATDCIRTDAAGVLSCSNPQTTAIPVSPGTYVKAIRVAYDDDDDEFGSTGTVDVCVVTRDVGGTGISSILTDACVTLTEQNTGTVSGTVSLGVAVFDPPILVTAGEEVLQVGTDNAANVTLLQASITVEVIYR